MLRICKYTPTLEFMLVDDETPFILLKSSSESECERVKLMLEESRKDRAVKHEVNAFKEKLQDFRLRLIYGEYDKIFYPMIIVTISVLFYFMMKGV